MKLTEENLKKLKARDPSYLSSLFEEINPYLHRLLSSRGHHGERAEEIIYESWLTFLEKLDSFEGRSSIRTYLTGILFHKIQEQHRANNKFNTTEEDLDTILDEAFTEYGMWRQKPSDPSHLFQQKEAGEMIRKCMEGLSAQQMQAFILREVDGEESASISESIGVSITHLGVLIFRAKEKLRKCIEGMVASPGKSII